jgi:hypothetical protein
MRRTIGLLVSAVAGVLILGACSSGGDPQSLGPVPTAPPTTALPTTSSTSTSTTRPAAVTTTSPPTTRAPSSTTIKPVFVDGIPQVTVTPSGAEVGTVVRIEGSGFTTDAWRSGATLWLVGGSSDCNLYAEARHSITVSSTGRLSGTFTVPAMGDCRMSDLPPRPVVTGTYRLAYGCTICLVGRFDVISLPDRCADVAFAANSDNVATDIIAIGISCSEAQALIRKVDAQISSVGGPSRVEVDGYTCVLTGEKTVGLPASDFECTNGAKTVRFRRF